MIGHSPRDVAPQAKMRDLALFAKLTAAVWFDYVQLMRVNGEWKIVNILFEGLPEERSERAGG